MKIIKDMRLEERNGKLAKIETYSLFITGPMEKIGLNSRGLYIGCIDNKAQAEKIARLWNKEEK